MVFSSSPHMVIRMSGSVPEGRTRRRPFTDLTFCSNCDIVDLTTSDVARLDFCAGVADMVRFTWGDLAIMAAKSCKDLPVAATALVTMRAVSIPSPVASPGKMM